MANDDIDRYLAKVGEPKRSTLAQLRRSIHAALPDAEECMSYGMPAFKVHGKTIAGFAAFKEHLAYLPHSGSTLSSLADDLAKYERTKSSLHFPIDEPLPQVLVNALVTTRLRELGLQVAQETTHRPSRQPPVVAENSNAADWGWPFPGVVLVRCGEHRDPPSPSAADVAPSTPSRPA